MYQLKHNGLIQPRYADSAMQCRGLHRITCVRDVSGKFFDRGVYWRVFSLFGWLSDHWVYCWVEPFVSLSLASWLPQPLKGWLIVASVAMFLKYQIEETEHMLSEKKYVITRDKALIEQFRLSEQHFQKLLAEASGVDLPPELEGLREPRCCGNRLG